MEKASNDEPKRATQAESSKSAPTYSNYTLKYASIIGLESGEAAAKVTTPNLQFGMGIFIC